MLVMIQSTGDTFDVFIFCLISCTWVVAHEGCAGLCFFCSWWDLKSEYRSVVAGFLYLMPRDKNWPNKYGFPCTLRVRFEKVQPPSFFFLQEIGKCKARRGLGVRAAATNRWSAPYIHSYMYPCLITMPVRSPLWFSGFLFALSTLRDRTVYTAFSFLLESRIECVLNSLSQ